MQPCTNPWVGLVLAHLEHPSGSLDGRPMELITQQFVCAALSPFGKGEAVRITEVRLFDEDDLAGRLTDMRVWLDQHHYEPSTFTISSSIRG